MKKLLIFEQFQTVEKAVRPQGIKGKDEIEKKRYTENKHKAFIENALCFLVEENHAIVAWFDRG